MKKYWASDSKLSFCSLRPEQRIPNGLVYLKFLITCGFLRSSNTFAAGESCFLFVVFREKNSKQWERKHRVTPPSPGGSFAIPKSTPNGRSGTIFEEMSR